jgi:hypothetical protein
MKRMFCILLILSLVFAMVSCGKEKQPAVKSDDLTPTLTADAFLKALKAQDLEALEQVYEGDVKDFSLAEEIDDPTLLALAEKAMEKMLDFDYTLDNEQINGNNATVDVLFKTYDFEGIFKDLTDGILPNIMDPGIFSKDPQTIEREILGTLTENFAEALKNVKKDKDVTVPLKLVRKGGKWMVKDLNKSDDLMFALSGGIGKFYEGIGKLFG